MTSRADQHDIDKLGRWHRDLTDQASDSFPVYAVFLVSETDQTAHDIFRAFRNSFQQRDAGFGNLVIFGQHGVSSTVHRLLSRMDLPPGSIPLVLVLPAPVGSPVYMLSLPGGGESGLQLPGPPMELLSRVEQFADGAPGAWDDAGLSGLTELPLPAADLATLVSELAGEFGQ